MPLPTDPEKRAKELHELIESQVARNKVTIAVLTTDTPSVIVGTSEKELREAQRKVLQEHEVEAKSEKNKHAEENVINQAKAMGLQGKKIGVSRPICLDCEELIKEENIETNTPFKGKKSKNRS